MISASAGVHLTPVLIFERAHETRVRVRDLRRESGGKPIRAERDACYLVPIDSSGAGSTL